MSETPLHKGFAEDDLSTLTIRSSRKKTMTIDATDRSVSHEDDLKDIVSFNDSSETLFADIRKLIETLDIANVWEKKHHEA